MSGIKSEQKSKRRKVTFSLTSSDAKEVILMGDFNQWNPKVHPMKKNKNGVWEKMTFLFPGTYEYRFMVDGHWKNDPNNHQTRTNREEQSYCRYVSISAQNSMIQRLKQRFRWCSKEIFNPDVKAEQTRATFKFRPFKHLTRDLSPENIMTSLGCGKELTQWTPKQLSFQIYLNA